MLYSYFWIILVEHVKYDMLEGDGGDEDDRRISNLVNALVLWQIVMQVQVSLQC